LKKKKTEIWICFIENNKSLVANEEIGFVIWEKRGFNVKINKKWQVKKDHFSGK
jgi:hypothetical protein